MGRKYKHYLTKLYLKTTNDLATRTHKEIGVELVFSEKVQLSFFTFDTSHVIGKQQEQHVILKSCWIPVYVNKYK